MTQYLYEKFYIKSQKVLEKFDEQIKKQKSLIIEKEKQKKWLKQNLLSGKRRLKEFEEPTCIELMINESVIKSKNIIYDESNFDLIKIIMNIFLEIFGEFEIWDLNSLPVEKQIKIKRVPWTVLPKGKYPWEKAKVFLKEFLDRVPEKQRKIISNRQKTISQYEPDFMAVGGEEFWGYVIYGFEKKNLFVFESNQINNATYIFKGEWEDASSLTKREIISRDLCEKRIIHTENWENTIQKLLKSNRKSEC